MTYLDLLIHNMHTFNINTLITYKQRQHLSWKPIQGNPQRCSSFGMRNISTPFVSALSLQTMLQILFTTYSYFSPLMLSSIVSLKFSSPSLYHRSTHSLDRLSSLQLYNSENKPLYFFSNQDKSQRDTNPCTSWVLHFTISYIS